MENQKVVLGVAQPHSWGYIFKEASVSLLTLIKPHFVYLNIQGGGSVDDIREAQTEKALEIGCTHVLYLDGDIHIPRDGLIKLFQCLNNGADLAGGLVFRGHPPFDPLLWDKNKNLMSPFVDYQFNDVVEAGASSIACLLVKIDVIKSIGPPWFRFIIDDNGEKVIKKSEGYYFSEKAVKNGFKLLVDTSINIAHFINIPVSRRFWGVNQLNKYMSTDDIINNLKQEQVKKGK